MSQELVKSQTAVVAVEPSGGADIMAVIARAAADDSCDVEKMERLFALKERMDAQERQRLFAEAIAAVQAEAPRITQYGTISFGQGKGSTKFARLEDVDLAMRPLMAREGLSLTVSAPSLQNGMLMVTGTMRHRAGHSEQIVMPMPPDKSGGKNEVQAMSSTILGYGRRLMLKAFFLVIEVGEDNDGNGAPRRITQKQADELNDLLAEIGGDERAKFLKWAGVERLADVPVDKFDRGMAALLKRRSGQ